MFAARLRKPIPQCRSSGRVVVKRLEPTDGRMKTENVELPTATDPLAPARGLRSLAERLHEYASDQVEYWERMPGPPWLERDLAACEDFIRNASSISGLGLDYEGGRLLAEAKNDRRELRRMREDAVLPYRRSAEVWRSVRARLALALKKSRGQGAQPQHLKALLALVQDLGRPLAEKDIQTIRRPVPTSGGSRPIETRPIELGPARRPWSRSREGAARMRCCSDLRRRASRSRIPTC